MKLLRIVITTLTLLSLSAFAHDGSHGIKGTVTATTDDTITITTTDNKTQIISFDARTQFVKSDAAVTAKDLKVGDRVVIESHDMNGKMHAIKVRFGRPAKKASTTRQSTDHSMHSGQEKK